MLHLARIVLVVWSLLLLLLIKRNGADFSGSGFIDEDRKDEEQTVSLRNLTFLEEEGWILTNANEKVGEAEQQPEQPVQEAIVNRNVRRVKQLLRLQNIERSSKQSGLNKTISHIAAENDFSTFLTERDLSRYYQPLALDANGESPCCYAAKAKQGKFFQQLLEMGREHFLFGNCSYANDHYGPTLHTAFYYNKQHLSIDSLSKNLASIKETLLERDSHGYSLLHVLSINTSVENEQCTKSLALFVSEHTDDHLLEARDHKGRTPFLTAALHGLVRYAEWLRIETSADPSAVDKLGYSAFHLTSSKQFLDYLLKIPNLKFTINSKSRHLQGAECGKAESVVGGMTPLHVAVREKKLISYIKFLLNNMDDINLENQCGQTPLHLAVDANYSAAMRLLLSHSNPLPANMTFFQAIDRRDVETAMRVLLEAKDLDNVNQQRKVTQDSALHEVADNPDFSELTNLLLQRGADTTIYNKAGLTPLLLAIRRKNWAVAKFITENGKQKNAINLADKDNLDSALHILAKCDGMSNVEHRTQILELTNLLIRKNANTSSFNKIGLTPLLVAVKAHHFDIAKVIVERSDQSSVNLPEKDSLDTPLHVVANYFGQHDKTAEELAVLLIKKGADTSSYNKVGLTPLFTAIWAKKSDMVKVMVENDRLAINLPLKNVPYYTPLHFLVEDSVYSGNANSTELASFFVRNGAKTSIYSKSGFTPLLLAISLGSFDIAKLMVENDPAAVSLPIKGTLDTPLHLVANYNGKSQVADELTDLLVKNGANCALYNNKGLTPFHVAITGNQFKSAKLIAQNSNATFVSLATKDSLDTPLHLLIGMNSSADIIELTSLILEKGADTTLRNIFGLTPLLAAIKSNKFEVAKMIAKSGNAESLSLGTKDKLDTALHLVAANALKEHRSQLNELGLLLLRKGARASSYNADGPTPLLLAIHSFRFDAAKYMITEANDKAIISLPNRNNLDTPLHVIANFSQGFGEEVVELALLLVKKGADASLYNTDGLTPLLVAITKYEIAKIIIENSSQAEVVSLATKDSLNSPLHLVAKSDSNADVVNALILKGANVCHFNKKGMTALHEAIVASAQLNAVSIANASQNDCPNQQVESSRDTALHLATRNSAFLELLKLLITKKAVDLSIKNSGGQTPLHIALINKNYEAAKLLVRLNRPGLLQAVDPNGRNPLHLAVENSEFVRLMVEYGKTAGITNSLLTRDELGDTPLFRAVIHNNMQSVKILLEFESCFNLNKQGQTPLHVAYQLGYTDLALIMLSSGKCTSSQRPNSCDGVLAFYFNSNTVLGCGLSPTIINGAVQSKDRVSCINKVATITCDKGFALIGSKEIICLSNGRWQISGHCIACDALPKLLADASSNCEVKQCDSVPRIRNGDVTAGTSNAVGTRRKITCQRHSKLRGPGDVICSNSGIWLVDGFCENRFFMINCMRVCGWSYDVAENECSHRAGGRAARLAVITNNGDFDFACSLLREPSNAQHVWVGLRLVGSGWLSWGKWQWSDGSNGPSSRYWLPGEPSNSGRREDAAEIGISGEHCGFNDINSNGYYTPNGVLCEYT